PAVAGPSVRSSGRMRRTPVLMASLPPAMKRPNPSTGKLGPKFDMDVGPAPCDDRASPVRSRGSAPVRGWPTALPGGRGPVKRAFAALATAAILVVLVPGAVSAERVEKSHDHFIFAGCDA